MRVLVALYPRQHLVLAGFLNFTCMLVCLEGSDTTPARLKDSHSGSSTVWRSEKGAGTTGPGMDQAARSRREVMKSVALELEF